MQQNFLMTLIKRWGSSNPKFWKIITNSGLIGLIIVSGVLWLQEYKIYTLPENWNNLLSHIDTFLAGVFVTGGLGTSNPDLMDNKTIERVKSDKAIR